MCKDIFQLKSRVELACFESIVLNNNKLKLSTSTKLHVSECFNFLEKFASKKLIYGINTGFGPMAQYRIDDNKCVQLQYNLIRSHCAGTGKMLSPMYVKAIMLSRLSTFLRGKSGIHPSAIELLVEFINNDIYPVIFEHGSVGASGDLVQLAHIAICLIGEGEVLYKGEIKPTKEVLEKLNLEPISMHIRDGLALLNGTSAMTGIGIINLIYAKQLFNWAIIASAMVNEITASFDDYFSSQLNEAKLHKGQQDVAKLLRNTLNGSSRIRKREDYFYNQKIEDLYIHDKVQEYYSLRCIPQILGPVLDQINFTEEILINETNSAGDNPIIDIETQNVYHGGNFHGDYVSFEMDKLKIAITKLTMLAERQLNYLFHDRLNNILPPFGNLGVKGLNYGMQACQFTATSTTAENQTLSFPNYVHSIPNNNDNQDMVSMGTNSALIAKTVIDNAYQVMSIHFMAICQAIDYLKIKDDLSPITKQIYNDIREFLPAFVEDTPKYKDIANVTEYLKSKKITLE